MQLSARIYHQLIGEGLHIVEESNDPEMECASLLSIRGEYDLRSHAPKSAMLHSASSNPSFLHVPM